MGKIKACFLLFSLLFCPSSKVSGQVFSSFEVGVSTSSSSILDKSYSSRWSLTPSKSLTIRTPFYIGIAGIGIDVFDYNARNDQVVDFASVNFSAYLGANALDFKRFKLTTGALVGIQRTEAPIVETVVNRIERELFFGVSLEPQYRIKNFVLFGDFQYRKVFNFLRQNLVFVGAGVRFRLVLPEKIYTLID